MVRSNGGTEGWFSSITDFPAGSYVWNAKRLLARNAPVEARTTGHGGLAGMIVQHVYADHNSSRQVRKELEALVSDFAGNDENIGLNFGSGDTRPHDRFINLDVQNVGAVDIVSDGSRIPLKDSSIDLLITQEVLEHIQDYQSALAEIERVLKPGGKVYCQLPFQIGFHPGPYDFRRFSRQGIIALFDTPKWQIEKVGISVGHGTAAYRILVEFAAVTFSVLHSSLYRPVKGLSAILLYPLKMFDAITHLSKERDRIPGGYFVVATRTAL
jgi:SAM-dependent methyltransferase